jgi:hypothetical protein
MINQSFILRPITEHIVGKKLDLAVRRFGGFVTRLFFEGLQGEQIT